MDTIFTRSIAAAQYKSGTSSLALDYRTNQLETLQMNNDSWELTENVRKAIRYLVDPDRGQHRIHGHGQPHGYPHDQRHLDVQQQHFL